MSDLEEQVLREMLLEVYRDVAPEHGRLGQTLMYKLASGLYDRGARIVMGANQPPQYQNIYISVDTQERIVWTDKDFHARLGYRPHSLIGKPIDTILTDGSAAYRRDFYLPQLIREGKSGPVPFTLVAANHDLVVGSWFGQRLLDSQGQFLRTFSRISVPALRTFLASLG